MGPHCQMQLAWLAAPPEVPRHLPPTVRLVLALAVAAAVAGAVRAKTKTKVAAAPAEIELSTMSLRTPLAPLAPLMQPRASAVTPTPGAPSVQLAGV